MAVLRPVLALLFRMRVEGSLPSRGAVIMAPNHVSYLDPVIVVHTVYRLGRRLRVLTTAAVFTNPLIGWVLRQGRFIEVHPGRGELALRVAEALLRDGESVLIYPEGHIAQPGVVWRAKPGVARLARVTGAPVVPVAQWGMQRTGGRWNVLRRRPASLVIGDPFTPSAATDAEAAEEVLTAIHALLPRAKELAAPRGPGRRPGR